MGAGGSLLVVTAFILLCAESMKLTPQNATFWGAVIVETVGMVIYVMHLFTQSLAIMDMVGFLLFVAAFILLCKSLLI